LSGYIFATKARIDNRKKTCCRYFATSAKYILSLHCAREVDDADNDDKIISRIQCRFLLKPNSITLSGSNQLRTSFKPAPNQLQTRQRNGIWWRAC